MHCALLEHRRKNTNNVEIRKKVLNQCLFVLRFEIVERDISDKNFVLLLGHPCIFDFSPDVPLVNLLLNDGDMVEK